MLTVPDDLRCSSPSNIGVNSSPATASALRGREESRTTIFQAINANGNPVGVLTVQEASRVSTSRSVNDPGVNLAGDVSVRTSPAPHNNPTLPGAGSAKVVTAGQPRCDVGAHFQNVPPLELLVAAAAQANGDALIGEDGGSTNPEHESGQSAEAPPVRFSLDAAAGIAASLLQPDLSAMDELCQPMSEESPWEAGRKEMMATFTCPQLSADGTSLPITETELAPISDDVNGSFLHANGATFGQEELDFTWGLSDDQWNSFLAPETLGL